VHIQGDADGGEVLIGLEDRTHGQLDLAPDSPLGVEGPEVATLERVGGGIGRQGKTSCAES
jgi:hypothetical protein